MLGLSRTLLLLSLLVPALASPAPVAGPAPGPLAVEADRLEERTITVQVDAPAGNIIGVQRIAIEGFTGIPFAAPPTGDLRLRPPQRLTTPLTNFDATKPSNACPQFMGATNSNEFITRLAGLLTNLPLFQKALKISEDCLNLNVFRPRGTKAGDKLPVLFWMYGGGFELGWNSMYDGGVLVSSAMALGKPYILVAVNYRVAGFGFMPGKEIKADGAGNIGHLDQRMGLEWVADNIEAFGGDPSKVTIWGESAGAISVYNQMSMYDGDISYKGKPLFRAGIMNSGSVVPAEPIDGPKGQAIYDQVVNAAGCAGAGDTLACLRALPYDKFLEASNSVPNLLSYHSVALSYLPRPDGKTLTDRADHLLKQKKYAAVPMIIGDQEDEGTIFSLFASNTTGTTEKMAEYLNTLFFPGAERATMTELVEQYSPLPSEGSPFGTGLLNEVFPGFKRLAALLGDITFTLARRIFLAEAAAANPAVPAWSYIASYGYGTPILGSLHGGDILQVFFGLLPNYASRGIHSYYANFVYNLDPNDASGGTSTASKVKDNWPQWTAGGRQLIRFYKLFFTPMTDDFREPQAQWLSANIEKLQI